jgi:hypothetical protein
MNLKNGKKNLCWIDMNTLAKEADAHIAPSGDQSSFWLPVNMANNRVEAIPKYALDDPDRLAEQLVGQFQFSSHEARTEAQHFLAEKLRSIDFSSFSEHPEKLRDFIYEMF